MTEEKIHKNRTGSWWALSPLLVFLCLYLVTSILVNDFYKVPITVAFLVSSCYAIAITKGLKLDQRIYQFSVGAANKNILLMIWIFILAGAFAHSAKQMGAIDATVNLTLHILPDNLLLAGIFIAACFISLSIGTSVGTIVALTPVAVGLAEKTEIALPFMVAVVVGGSFFGDNLSFISDNNSIRNSHRRNERDARTHNRYIDKWHHWHRDRQLWNFRLVWCHGNGNYRNGRTDYYHSIGRRDARNHPL